MTEPGRLQTEPALVCTALFPSAIATVQLPVDPYITALQLQAIRKLQGGLPSNPDPGCAWTGDLNGVWQLHRQPLFAPLLAMVSQYSWHYLEQLGFDRGRLALHLQRCWPVVSEFGQVVGRHHHPNAHLSAVYYLNGDGSGRSGCLRFHAPAPVNELVPGMAVGHGSPILAGSDAALRWNAPCFDLAPQAGLLVLFPARLEHSVLPNQEAHDSRFSISFDLVITAPPTTADEQPAEYLAPHPADWHPLQDCEHLPTG